MKRNRGKFGAMSNTAAVRPVLLITGVSGLIGESLVKMLCEQATIVGLDIRPPTGGLRDCVEYVEADLTSDASVRRALSEVRDRHGNRLSSVFHLAAYYDFSGEPSPLYEKLTVEGTHRLLRCLQRFDDVEQFVFSSTILVMEPRRRQIIDEQSPIGAEWDYPRSKLDAERVIREEHGSIPTVVLRIAGVYDEYCHSIPIAQQIQRIYEKTLESYVFPGRTDSAQAFVHRNDLATCFRRVFERRTRLSNEELFLVAEPEIATYSELQELLGQMIHGEAWPAIRIPKPVAKAGAWVKEKLASEDNKPFIKPWMIDLADDNYAVNIQHARTSLDWLPRRSLRGTLSKMVAALREDPRRWYGEHRLPTSNLPTAEHQKATRR